MADSEMLSSFARRLASPMLDDGVSSDNVPESPTQAIIKK